MKRKQLSASHLGVAKSRIYIVRSTSCISATAARSCGVRLSELDVGCVVSSRRGERGTYVERDGCFDILILAHC